MQCIPVIMILHYRNCTKAFNFPPKLQYVQLSFECRHVQGRKSTSGSELESLTNICCEVMVNCPPQFTGIYCTTRRPLRGCNFLENKKRVLNGILLLVLYVWDSSVGIATRYGLDGPGKESPWGKIFRTQTDRPWSQLSLLHNGYRVFPGGTADGAWRWLPTPSCAEVKEWVMLHIYSPPGPSWTFMGRTLPFSWLPVLCDF